MKAFLDYLKPILTDFNKEVRKVYFKNYYHIHNLAGFGIGLMICCLPFPNLFMRIVCVVPGSWAAGFLNEGYQFTVHKAKTDERDMRMTGYGGVISLPVFYTLLWFGIPFWIIPCSGLLILLLAIFMRKKS